MKYYKFLLVALVGVISYGQDFNLHLESMIKSEASTALNKMRFAVNNNTSNYNIVYNRLALNVDPAVAEISGDVTAHYRAKENMNQIVFDLADNLNVSQVLQRGNHLSFTQNTNDELVIDLTSTLNQGALDSLTISYSGNPKSSGFGSFEQTQHNGDEIIWTLSEPYGAKGWWPCKQDLIDKIDSVDVYLTTPRLNSNSKENIAVSNGVEQSQVINGDLKTTHFRHRYPIPAYLVAIAVTNYAVYNHTVDNNGKPFDIVNYVYPENLASAQSDTGITVDIMNLFSDLFEEYPFADEKYGHAQFGWGGGMEHTTVSFMGNFSRNLIAHELAHQWFGNKITCGSWQDIWLNEGFATYLSGLVIEDFDGEESFTAWKQQRINSITSQAKGSVYVPASDTLTVRRVFNGRLSYNKGAMVLHMLRKKLGDDKFYSGIKDFLADPNFAFGYAHTEEFKTRMETSTGVQLEEFFNDWIYGEGHPIYDIVWGQIGSDRYKITVSQSQSDASVSFFESPLTFKLIGQNGEEKLVTVENTENDQDFEIASSFTVTDIEFDPFNDVISLINNVSLVISDDFEVAGLVVFPNPVSEHFQIKKPESIEIKRITIHNTLGQLMYSEKFSDEINIENYQNGLYFLQLHTNTGLVTKTLLKK